MRVKRSVTARKRHKRILKLTKGMGHGRRASYRKAHEAILKALSYQYRDRRNLKRDIRSVWITRISAAAKSNNISYSQLMANLEKSQIKLNRKILAELATNHPLAFKALVEQSQAKK